MTRVLVLNAGSSSLKWSLLDAATEELLAEGNEEWPRGEEWKREEKEKEERDAWTIVERLRRLPAPRAIGHRLVHGGVRFREPRRLDASLRRHLAELAEIDPLHTGRALTVVEAAFATFPGLPQIAAFDTTFHTTLPDPAAIYPVPYGWTKAWGLRRLGFHGLSVAYAVRRTREILGELPRRLIVCHLGSGSSLTAVLEGRSVDTTMGFTPLEGVMMGTRSGSVDPGLLLWVQHHRGYDHSVIEDELSRRSGLYGIAGSADLRQVLAAADAGKKRARLAYAMFLHSLCRALGALAAVLGGVDGLVFTGGIGEHSARVRRDVAPALAFAGLTLDEAKNEATTEDAEISAPGSPVRVLVVTAREDLTVLAEVRRVLSMAVGDPARPA